MRRVGDFGLECVKSCQNGEFAFNGRCFAECPTGTFRMTGASSDECYSSCPDGYVPNGSQCDARLAKSSGLRVGLLVTFGVLCVAAFVLWLVLRVCSTSRDRQRVLQGAQMRAIQQANM